MKKADPQLLISTCATFDRPSGDYHKSLGAFKGLESLYDVISVHSYAFVEGYPRGVAATRKTPASIF